MPSPDAPEHRTLNVPGFGFPVSVTNARVIAFMGRSWCGVGYSNTSSMVRGWSQPSTQTSWSSMGSSARRWAP